MILIIGVSKLDSENEDWNYDYEDNIYSEEDIQVSKLDSENEDWN